MYIDTTNAAAGRIVLNAEKADKDAYGREIHRFYESMVPQGTVIPSNTNLNTINFLQVGNYYCSQDATVKTLTNCPTDQAFMMRVYSPLSTTVDNEATSTYVYRLRKIITYKGQEYYQAVNSGTSASTFTYGPWYSELNSQGKLTLSGDLSGSVDLSNNMTLTADITASGVTAGKYGPTANSTPAHGASFKVPEFTVAADGRITAATTRTITLPADNNTTYGLSAESGHIIQLKDNNNGVTKVTLVQGNDMVLTTDTANDKITIAHEAFTTTKASKNTTATPAHGGTFDVLDSVTTDNGHVTGYTVKTVTLPVDNNTTYTISAKNNIITLDGSTGTDTTVTLAAGNDINVSTGTSDNKITIKHQDFTTTPTTSSATDKSPAHGGSFSVIDGITTDNGHITGYTTKSIKLPADNNTTSSISAEYNSTDKKHQIRLTESSGTTYNVELAPGNDITLTTDTTNDKITITHEAFTTTGTTSSATDKSPAAGGSFSVVDGITTDNGHITGYTTKSITLPADNNTTYSLSVDANKKVTLTGSNGTTTGVTFNNGKNIGITQSGNNLTITHDTFTTAEGTKTTAAPAHGATFDVLDSITTSNGHVTGFVKKTVTLPADNNTDTKVTQTAKSDNVNYPLLGAYAASPTSGTAADVVYDTGMHMNPSTNTITATTFAGNLSGNATTSSSCTGNAATATTAASCSGNAATATKLATARTIRTNLGSTSTASFDGSGNITPGVTGTLPLANGGLGATTASGGRSTLGLTYAPAVYTIDLSAYANTNFYLMYFESSEIELDCIIWSLGGMSSDKWNQNYIHFQFKDNGWSDSPYWLNILGQGSYQSEELTIMNIVHGSQNGLKGVYLRGGLFYTVVSNHSPSIATSTYTYGNESYGSGTTSYTTLTNASIMWTNDGSTKSSFSAPLYGAVWNDYAEFRSQKEEIKPGYCVASADDGQVYKTTEKFQACDGIVSDTFGFAIGETDNCKTPLAVAGRVLAYYEGDRYSYHSGDTVCAGPDGKVVKMTREEIREWPDRIIGIVSEIPEYETWGTGNVAVDGRIWIKIK